MAKLGKRLIKSAKKLLRVIHPENYHNSYSPKPYHTQEQLEKHYRNSRRELISIFSGEPYSGLVNDPVEKQFPLVLDALALFICALDGNAFYTINQNEEEWHHQQYYDYALEVLKKGFTGLLKSKFKKISIKELKKDNYGLGPTLCDLLDKITKEEIILEEKKSQKRKEKDEWIRKNS
jgi:hypothetical protein